jgi:TP901 family phage tail tape measure protein
LSAELRRDKRKIDAFQSYLKRRPLSIPVRLDLRDAVSQAAAMRKTILGQFASLPASILGADGRPATAPTSGGGQMNKKAGVLSTTTFEKFDDKEGKWVTDRIEQVEQLGRGLSKISKFKDAASAPFATVTKDISNVQDLKEALAGMNAELGKAYGKARGSGDRQGQIAALTAQRQNVNAALQQAATRGLQNSPDYQRAEKQVSRLSEKISSLEGREESAAVKQARKDRTREIANQITQEERRVQEALKGNKLEMDASERIKDRAAREKEVNRLYDERRKIFQQSRDKFRAMDQAMQGEDRPDLADRAMRRGLGMDNQANQAALDKQRAETDRMREAAKEQEKIDKENQKRAEKAKRVADQAAAKSGKRNFSRAMRLDDYATKQALIRNDAERAAAAAIPDRAAREAELNRILSERSRIYQDQANRIQRIQFSQDAAGNVDNAAKAEAAKLKAQTSADNVVVDQTKADAASQIAAAKEAEAAKRKQEVDARSNRDASFKREMQDIKARSERRIAQINTLEKKLRAAAKSASERSKVSQIAHQERLGEYTRVSGDYQGVESRARAAGSTGIADTARGKRLDAGTAAARDMQKFATATTASGHALNFHSSQLLRNAATFAKWMVPVQAVLGMVRAFSAGFSGAMKVDRQFATLRAVFRGTEEEAQKLKESTLDLAASQGRSADEAMDAAVRWSRLGFNRVQVNEAVKTSLMAANVAEISAAEAAEKLSAIYATYRLNVGDLPIVLSRLNAISNRYNVTNKDLLEGLVRVAGVANQSGMALRDLEGIIGAVTGATGRPGQEVGNALKFVITRLAAPETMQGLKDAFDIDLTGPNGDLKDMSQIFRELADIFPTLNNAQKQYFLKLTAGSRQASRFALILDQYRQGQILAMEAAFDTSSAFTENQKILESLQSRVDSLKASWTALFTAWGDAGMFDFLNKRLRYLQSVIQEMDESIDDAQKRKRDITINDPLKASRIEKLGGGDNEMFGTREQFSKEEIAETVRRMREALEREKKKGGFGKAVDFFGQTNPLTGNRDTRIKVRRGLEIAWFKDAAALEKAVEQMEYLLESGGNSAAEDALSAITNNVNALRSRLEGLEIGGNVFDSIAESAAQSGADIKILTRDFEKGAHGLLKLENGTEVYGEVIKKFYELANSGDTAGIAKYAEEVSRLFKDAMPKAQTEFDAKLQPALEALRAKMKEAEDRRSKLLLTPQPTDATGGRDREDQMEEMQKEVTMWQGAINQLLQVREMIKESAFGPKATAGINAYLDDLGKAAELFKEAFQDFAPDAQNDPVARIFQRKRNSLELGRDWLMEVQKQTNAKSREIREPAQTVMEKLKIERDSVKDTDPVKGNALNKQIEEQQRIIDQQNEADQIAATSIRKEEERIRRLERELEIQEQIANLQRVSNDSSRFAENSSLAWRFGKTESDKDANQAAAAIERAKAGMAKAGGDWLLGKDTPVSRASASGQVLQDEATARANLEAMERRQYELEAARKQVAIDMVKAMREQTEEASKRLMLASREDQLRAAALARTIRDKGPLGDNEFFALSQETRQAVTNYLPNQGPDILNEAKRNAAKSYEEIDNERGRLTSTIGDIRGALDALAKRITEVSGKGGALDPLPPAPGQPLQDAAGKGQRDQSPIVNVNLGDIAVSVALSGEINRLLTDYVDRRFVSEIKALEGRLRGTTIPSAYGAVE